MVQVPWHALDPNKCEKFIAIMILRENPHGRRREPSRGDDGIDVLVPVPEDPTQYDVYQIKYFFQRLKSSQRAQIRKSAGSLLKAIREDKIAVRDWHLVLPLDPTEGDEDWLQKLFEGTDVAAYWKGETHLEGWAARYQDVVDYYLLNGHEQTREIVSRVLTLAELKASGPDDEAMSADAVLETLGALHSILNRQEPHYRFELLTGIDDGSMTGVQNCPAGAVMRSCSGLPDGRVVCIDVFPRYDEAYIDNPIEGVVQVTIPRSRSDLIHALGRFREFGESVTIPAGFVQTLTNDPLHGLQYSDSMNITFEPIAVDPVRVRLLIHDPTGDTLQALPVTVERLTTGELGGMIAELVSDSGLFRLRHQSEASTNSDRRTMFQLSVKWAEAPAIKAISDLRFADAVRSGNTLSLANEHSGPVTEMTTFKEGFGLTPPWLLQYCEALVAIQEYANEPLKLLVPEDGSAKFIDEAFAAARFSQGAIRTVSAGRIIFSADDPVDTCAIINRDRKLLAGGPYSGDIAGVQVSFPDAVWAADEVQAEVVEISGTSQVSVTGQGNTEFEVRVQRERYIVWNE